MKPSDLQHMSFLQSFSPELRKAMMKSGEVRSYQKGERIFVSGDNHTDFYVLVEGRIQIYKLSQGGQKRIMRTVRPGESFALVSLFDDQPMFISCEVLGPTKVFVIEREKFFELLKQNHELSLFVIKGFVQRIRTYGEAYTSMTVYSVGQRFTAYLLDLVKKTSVSEVRLPDSITTIAEQLGTSREVLSREISKMVRAGLIEKKGQVLKVVSRAGLEKRLNAT